jgi:sulfatase modifying factor 1
MKLRSLLGLIVAPLAAAACSLVFPVPDANDTGDGGAASGGGGGGGSVDAGVLTCAQTGRGPKLVPAGDRLCIDSTPVTRAEYVAFLDAGVPTTPQILGCEGNTSWTPLGPLGPDDAGDVLVDGTDWCDAWGYCAWAGKTLCGGFPGEHLPAGEFEADGGFEHGLGQMNDTDRDASAMVWACEGGDAGLVYPYGNDLDSTQCFQPSFFYTAPVVLPEPVGSTGCAGGFPGLVDMVGVPQWTDSCSGGQCTLIGSQTCRSVSYFGSSLAPAAYPQYQGLVAFRCCGVAPPTR